MYSSNAPDELTRWDVMPTLLILFPEDWVILISVIPLLIRMGLVHLVLLYGTNNMITTDISDIQLRRREIGSGLVLGARIFYALFIWTAKYTIAEFLTRLTAQTWRRSFQLMLNFIRFFLVVTFAAVVISTLAECQPFQDYWQVSPMPTPKCRQGYAHLVAMGACDAATDILLVAFPIPIIFSSSTTSTRRKASLTLLFSLSIILVAMTCYRVPAVIERHGNQQYRSLFASLEVLVATAISNAIVIGSFMRDRGVKKQKYRIGSVSEASDQKFSRRATITTHQWGSDADLATDVGIRLDPEAEMPIFQEIRAAPLAHANNGHPEKNSLSESKVAPCHRLERDEDIQPYRRSQKPFPFGRGAVPNTPECTASDTISTITPKPSPNDCLYDVGGLFAGMQVAPATASPCAANGPTFIPPPEPRLKRLQFCRRSCQFLDAVTNSVAPSPRNSGSTTGSATGSAPGPGLQDQPRESRPPRLAREGEECVDTCSIGPRRLQLNDLGNLLNQESKYKTPK
ncbi:hypothetical protein ACJ73_08593 [Blastomyces percursus]|uniref:Rhodopsin domain-containing protein n=1 Tax=Blastomyces percursus TaxID=1658174 RepID=A0A1J9QIP8_9EURO|nr:hypothetical protein ACJ73_08593 [Blastomyces percursus]